jgi:2-polyprenyl-3-methyl-5-hydroxy-6-metoxy-1,4-benzoquinol methylase
MKASDYQLVEDPDYGFLKIQPTPSQEDVEKFYLEEFYSGEYKKFNDSDLSVQQKDRDFFRLRWQFIYEQCSEILGCLDGRELLDIGCGYCQALLYFQEVGLSVSGLEPSIEGYNYGIDHGINMFHGGVDLINLEDQKEFDIVTLLNVLEHLRDPVSSLKSIRSQCLKKGGILVVDVPNEFNDFQVVAQEEYGLSQWWVCPPAHLNYFSPESLNKLLQGCGYNVIHMESSFPLEMFLLMGDVYVGNSGLGSECHRKRVLFEQTMVKHGKLGKLRDFYSALSKLGLGRQITAYATPI